MGVRRKIMVAVLTMGAAAALAGRPMVAEAVTVNNDPTQLVVYNNNIENMVTCTGNDYKRLLDYMRSQPKAPDLFVVQQVSNQAKLDELIREMNARLPGPYTGRLALSSTGSLRYTGACSSLKNHQTNAVIWRAARFGTTVGQCGVAVRRPEQQAAQLLLSDPDCVNLYYDRNGNSQDRVANVAVRLYDPLAQKHVTVASIHWPTSDWGGPDCADENMREASDEVDGLGGSSLKIVAGDANTTVGSADGGTTLMTTATRIRSATGVPRAAARRRTRPSGTGASTTSWRRAAPASATPGR